MVSYCKPNEVSLKKKILYSQWLCGTPSPETMHHPAAPTAKKIKIKNLK